MAITPVITETVNAVAGVDTQFAASGSFILYGDYFKADEKAELQRLGPSGDYVTVTDQMGPVIVTECPNMVYVGAPGSYQLVKSATRTPASVGIQSPYTLELLINTDEYLGLKLAELLAANTKIVYDPQDLTTLYQDARGALPVYRPGTGLVDPPVGLMLDKSRGLELGPELVTNQTFDTDLTGWSVGSSITAVQDAGEALVTFNGVLIAGGIYQFASIIPTTAGGKVYSIEFDATYVSGAGDLQVGIFTGESIQITAASNGGVKTRYRTNGLSGLSTISRCVAFASVNNGGVSTWRIDNVSCREIKGYHAYQTTPPARPTLSGRYNLLTATDTFSTQSVTTGAGIHTLRFEGAGSVTISGTATGTYSAGTHAITCTAGALTCTVAGTVTRVDLRVKRDGSSLPAYQSVTNANTYDTAGFPLYLKRDKVDDVLTCVAPAITGSQGMGSTGGAVLGPVIIPAGAYTPLAESAITGIPEITRYVAIDGALTASEHAVVERYLSVPSSGVFAKTPVFSFGLTSVASFSFTLQTKADTTPVLIDWGDGTQSTHAGTTDQTASHTYAVSGTYMVKVYGADNSVLTKFYTVADGMSGALVMPAGMTTFYCTGSNTLSGTLSLPAGMTYFNCTGSNTLSGTLSLPSGMTFFVCAGPNTLTGTLSMPSGMTFFNCQGSNTLTGTLSIPSGMTSFDCTGSNTLSGYTPAAKASNQRRFRLLGLNTISSTDVDNVLIDYDAAGGTWEGSKEIVIQGNAANRTSASDAAYASLATKLTTLSVD